MKIYQIQSLQSEKTREEIGRSVQRDRGLLENLIEMKYIVAMFRLFPEEVEQVVTDEMFTSWGIEREEFDRLLTEGREPSDPLHEFIAAHRKKMRIMAESLWETTEQCRVAITFPFTSYTALFQFVMNTDVKYLTDLRGVYSECELEYSSRGGVDCTRYHVGISDSNREIITMMVKVNEQSASQIHIFIQKSIQYTLFQHFNDKKQLRNSSILLHSFASWAFGSDVWFTCPLESMATILQRSNIPYTTASQDESRERYPWFTHGICGNSMGSCPAKRHFFIETREMRDIWLSEEGEQMRNTIPGLFVVSRTT
jgi:hypothetical protein